jgi:rhamnosyl/mannosyltransferase
MLREKYGGRPLVFALGRDVQYKGFDVLIRAMAHVPATLLLGGEGPLTQELKQLASNTRADVVFVGLISEQLLPAYYHACDVFCFPSVAKTDTFGLVQAEAMACCKPIVNTALLNGVNELAPNGFCALTVTPGNPIELANALIHLITNPELSQQLGNNGRKRLCTDYTVDRMVDATISLYCNITSERTRTVN